METVLLVLVTILTMVYLWFKYKYSYWSSRGLPQPPTVLGCGNILDSLLMRKNIGLVYDQIYRDYPDCEAVGVYSIYTPRMLLRSPQLIQKVMASNFSHFHDNEFTVSKKLEPYFYEDPFCLKGEEWKHNRAKIVSTMTSSRMKEIFPFMKEIIPRLDAYLQKHFGKDLEAKELATLFTMDNVSNSVFGMNSDCFTDPNAVFRKVGYLFTKETLQVWWKTTILRLMPRLRNLIGLRFVPTVVNDYIESVVKEMVQYRLKNNVNRNDLFQYFMKKSGDDYKEMMFYSMTFYLEASETSSMLASHTLYELAMNSHVQDRLFEELHGAFGDKEDIDYETLNNLSYLDKVLLESHRKYPAIFNLIRVCTRTIDLDINGKTLTVENGTPMVIPVLSLQRDAKYYPEPDVFDPERFSDEVKQTRPQYTYLPFGEGPRICPGMRFALTQIKLFIAHVVYNYRVLRCEKTPEKLTFAKGASLVIANEKEWIRIEKRRRDLLK
ncbi:probable cytochrome P450 28a5 [Homalodisca vitripennis]|uniref:probable cytochrome P450 28a5 n=1 Tax=Homalodisca vitripennis TaxID=197043 RepID=UPI001EEB54EE|nr:probable cytochrome P450 28a5 [Homalodisca vitripennis]XP_046676238.1 probable cytochrome P450 28a5 [Homalodisca vitripennis]XP_046676239.1 probable cytochrome P450 28a5 [Homalodisca vitripennis]